ncbi:unnamed protein product [Brachionus calyciflorus]|uniref:Protein CUSTOS n=1 Tax=Brachionus calyciflorus TaxID=104777 RepID=A0A814H809_9BILA|nr:unnamed protein product [Brachionus calyciflorus]
MPRSSSSSDDEEEDSRLQQLREVAVTFEALNKPETKNTVNQKSKRIQETEDDPSNLCEVTPEFQEFVAKKLMKKLDESIEIYIEPPKKIKKKNKSDDTKYKFELTKNIFMTNDFDEKIDKSNNDQKLHKNSKKKKKKKSKEKSESDSDSEEDMQMLKEAAIDINFLAKTTCIDKHKKEFLS